MARKSRGRPPGTVPRYRVLSEQFQQKLESGAWAIGQPIPSCRELAREYRVGVKTIWRALQTLKTQGRLRISRARRATAVRRVPLDEIFSGAIVLVLRSGLTWFSGMDAPPGLGHGVFRALQPTRDTCIVVQHMDWWRYRVPEGLRDLPLKGMLLWGPFPQALLRQYEAMNVPAVLMDQPADGLNMNAVTVDNYHAAFDATTRLLKKGHTRIAFLRSIVHSLMNIDPDARERQEGFVAACRAAGLNEQHYRIVSATFDGQRATLRELFRERPRPTAILSASEFHLEALAQEAHAVGLKIPQQLSVASFRLPQLRDPDWSGPIIEFEKMGAAAVELLKRGRSRVETLRIPTHWHEGQTIAAPPKSGRGILKR